MDLPLVTVLVPTYNRANYIRGTVNSVLAQSYPHVEVIVLDDASTDETPKVGESFAHEPRVTWIRHESNLGMVRNWRAAREQVRGEFFCLLNDDDSLGVEFVESLIRPLLDDENAIIAFCDHWVIDGTGKLLSEYTERCSAAYHRDRLPDGVVEDFASAMALHRSLHISCSLLRTRAVPPTFFDDRAGGFACGWLFYQCYRTGLKAYYSARRLASYRLDAGNMANDDKWHSFMCDGHIYWAREMLRDASLQALNARLRSEVAGIFAHYASSLLYFGDRRRARDLFAESFSLKRNFKAFVGYGLAQLGSVGRGAMIVLRQFHPRRSPVRLHT